MKHVAYIGRNGVRAVTSDIASRAAGAASARDCAAGDPLGEVGREPGQRQHREDRERHRQLVVAEAEQRSDHEVREQHLLVLLDEPDAVLVHLLGRHGEPHRVAVGDDGRIDPEERDAEAGPEQGRSERPGGLGEDGGDIPHRLANRPAPVDHVPAEPAGDHQRRGDREHLDAGAQGRQGDRRDVQRDGGEPAADPGPADDPDP